MKGKHYKLLTACGFLLTVLSGCYDYTAWDTLVVDPFSPSIVMPVMKSTITFRDLVEKADSSGFVQQKPGSDLYYVIYRDTIDLGAASELFDLPDGTFDDFYEIPAGQVPPVVIPGIQLGPYTQVFTKSYDGVAGTKIKRVDFTGGSLHVTLTNNFHHAVVGKITLLSLQDPAGRAVEMNFNLSVPGSSYTNTVSLKGFHYNLLLPPSTYNTLQYSVTATLTTSAYPGLEGNVAVNLNMQNPVFSKITGKVNQEYDISEQSGSVGLFASTIIAEQHLSDPKYRMKVVNSFGIPTRVNIGVLAARNNAGDVLPVVHEGPVSPDDLLPGIPMDLGYATEPGDADTVLWQLQKENSNIEDVFDIAPSGFDFAARLIFGDETDEDDYFVLSDSRISVMSEVELPLAGWVVTHEINDTVENIDWPDLEEDLKIDRDQEAQILIKLRTVNEIPLNLYFQIRFLDEAGLEVTRLFDDGLEWLVKSSPVNPATGESSGSTTNTTTITLDQDKYGDISRSKHMIIVYKFTTGGALKDDIKVLSTNRFGLDVGVQATGTIHF